MKDLEKQVLSDLAKRISATGWAAPGALYHDDLSGWSWRVVSGGAMASEPPDHFGQPQTGGPPPGSFQRAFAAGPVLTDHATQGALLEDRFIYSRQYDEDLAVVYLCGPVDSVGGMKMGNSRAEAIVNAWLDTHPAVG